MFYSWDISVTYNQPESSTAPTRIVQLNYAMPMDKIFSPGFCTGFAVVQKKTLNNLPPWLPIKGRAGGLVAFLI